MKKEFLLYSLSITQLTDRPYHKPDKKLRQTMMEANLHNLFGKIMLISSKMIIKSCFCKENFTTDNTYMLCWKLPRSELGSFLHNTHFKIEIFILFSSNTLNLSDISFFNRINFSSAFLSSENQYIYIYIYIYIYKGVASVLVYTCQLRKEMSLSIKTTHAFWYLWNKKNYKF